VNRGDWAGDLRSETGFMAPINGMERFLRR
jgi:hypothetical protein